MSREQLLIPMAIRAMLVGEPQDYFAGIAYNYKSLSSKPLGNNIEPNHGSKYINEDKGVHIHWLLPEAMKEGIQDEESDDVIYPSVPNRWQVTRLWLKDSDPDGEVSSISWTVESDVLQKEVSEINGNQGSPQFPTLTDLNRQYGFLGRSYLYNKTLNPCKEVLEKLTAVAPGLPTFSSYYPGCRNVFGFYDSMVDEEGNELENVIVTYVVCGWYSDSNKDILNGISSREECKEKLGWAVPENFSFPAISLCHGTISGIKWVSKKKQYQSNIPTDNIEVAVGNNTAEALAALQEHKNSSGYTMERMLNLFYSSGEVVLKDKNGLLKGENKVHQDRFGEESPITQIAIKGNDKGENNSVQLYDNNSLREINLQYIELFNKKAELQSLQEQVYDCWYKYVLLGEETYFDYDEKEKAIKYQQQYIEKIKNFEKYIEDKGKDIEVLQNKIDSEKAILSEKFSNDLIVSQNGQSFWAPNEPVLLLSGVKRDNTYGEYESSCEDNTLFCRSSSQIITSLTIDSLQGAFNIPTKVDSDQIGCKGSIPTIIEPFVKEAFIISSDFSLKLAAKILDLRKCRNDENLKALTEKIRKLQSAQINNKLITSLGRKTLSIVSGFHGVYPEKWAMTQWKKPWAPLLLKWTISYYSDPNLLKEVPTLKDWVIDETLVDYHFKGEILIKEPEVIKGQSILSPNASAVTAGCSMYNLGNENIAREALNMDVLSQSLSGINNKFLMEKNDIILPVNLVNSRKVHLGNEKLSFDKVASLLEGFEFTKPCMDEFFAPIRGGIMNIDNISIIDSFGQLKEIKNPNAAVAENMRNSQSVAQNNIMLTPRLIQPSRLNFRWINPDTDAIEDENSIESPICGWLLPNHTDKSIMVYDNKGNLLGSLQRVKLDDLVVWKDNPKNGGGTVPLPKDMNKTLYEIIASILHLSHKEHIDLLSPLLNVIDSALWNINPDSAQQYNSLAQYVGRPLIVVNSCVKLEQRDIPKRFKHLETREDTGGYNSNIDVTKAKFNVQVGRTSNHGDGVIGFFKDNNYDTMYITASEDSFCGSNLEGSYFNTQNNISIAIGDEYPAKLTIIMDFAASVDLISGFLPTKTVKPNDYSISETLDKIYFTIFSAPILGDINEFAIPCPKLDGREWSWLHYRDYNFKEDNIFKASQQAYFPQEGVCAEEGWLKLNLNKVSNEEGKS